MADLAHVLLTHKDNCSPLTPCAHCEIARFLAKRLAQQELERLRACLSKAPPDLTFTEHSGDCSPWHPCVACESAALLREHLVPATKREIGEQLRALESPVEDAATEPATTQEEDERARVTQKLETPWKDFFPFLSRRTHNCLENEGYVTVGDIVRQTEADMLRVPNLGRRSLNELKELVLAQGLHFGWK